MADLLPMVQHDKFFRLVANGTALWEQLAPLIKVDPAAKLEVLGVGSQARAYALPGSRALKITADETDARALAIVRWDPDPEGRVVRVDSVFELEGKGKYGPDRQYAIVMDQLEAADPAWLDLVDAWPNPDKITPDNVRAFIAEFDEPRLVDLPEKPEFFAWLTGLADYLAGVKIAFGDLWSDNLLRDREGRHQVFDLGYSASPGNLAQMVDETLARLIVRAKARDSDAYLIDQLAPVLARCWPAVLAAAGYRQVDGVRIDSAQHAVELVARGHGGPVALLVRGSFARARDGEWTVRASRLQDPDRSAERHDLFAYDPQADLRSILAAALRVLRAVARPA